jgi:hypothetical protein
VDNIDLARRDQGVGSTHLELAGKLVDVVEQRVIEILQIVRIHGVDELHALRPPWSRPESRYYIRRSLLRV